MLVIMMGEFFSIYELCYEKRYCFLVVLNVDDDYNDDSFVYYDLLIVWM